MSMNEQVKNKDFPGKSGKDLPFKAPEGYFEHFAERLQTRMQVEEERSWMSRTYQLIRPQLAMAAIIIGFVAISYTGIRIILNDRTTEPSVMEIAYALDGYLYDMDDELLITTIIDEEIEIEWINGGYGSDDIMDYLMEEELDFTNLIDEFNIY